MDPEQAVRDRYSRAADRVELALCCPTQYDPRYLELIPAEVLEKDYGCGDPSAYAEPGQTVLDLGSGGGKICYIASQIVGPEGRVIGVDFNDDMLAVAEKYRGEMADRLGYANVEFRKGYIQNLRRDLRAVDRRLEQHPPRTSRDLAELEAQAREQERERPLVADESVDLVVSNCVLNLVRPEEKDRLFSEIYRVLRNGGRAVISDIVADEDVPQAMRDDPELWSGCISGALRDEAFLSSFLRAGFHGVEVLSWSDDPWRTVDGIEFRSMTVSAYKGKVGPCWERHQAVIYKGPWSAVEDDDHHRYERGRRVAVCDKTFNLLRRGPYAADLIFLEPSEAVSLDQAEPFDCSRTEDRHPRELKERGYRVTGGASECCGSDAGCC
jgi:SAM-dependent methyltransferase